MKKKESITIIETTLVTKIKFKLKKPNESKLNGNIILNSDIYTTTDKKLFSYEKSSFNIILLYKNGGSLTIDKFSSIPFKNVLLS